MHVSECLTTTVYRTRFAFLAVFSIAVLGGAGSMGAETLSLAPARTVGSTANIEVVLQVGGDLLLASPGQLATDPQLRKVPMNVSAKLVYDERLLSIRPDEKGASRSARYYHAAKAEVEIEKGEQLPALDALHRLIAVETTANETTLICPGKSLTREELDLIDVTANSLVLDELLPTEPVAVGATWKHSENLLAALLRLDAVSLCDVQSMFAEVNRAENAAKISLAGTVHGAVGGVATEIEVKAKYSFDLRAKRITLFALLIKEKRSVGHIGPGFDLVAKQIVRINPIEVSEHLGDDAVSAADSAKGNSAQQLTFASSISGFRVQHDRRWFVAAEDKRLTVFRLVDRGELVAQCNITSLDPVPAGETFLLADFQKDIEKSLDKKFGQFVSAKEETDSSGRRVYRATATGTVSELPIQWIYYMFMTREGRRLSIAFTMEQSLVSRFGDADRQFLSALEIAPVQTAAGGGPTPAKR